MSEHLVTIDNRLALSEAGREAGVTAPTIFRWITDGLEGVRLKHARLGRRLYTSKPALDLFMNEVAASREAKMLAGNAA